MCPTRRTVCSDHAVPGGLSPEDEVARVTRVLLEQMDQLTERSVREVRQCESAYRDVVSVEELSWTSRRNIELILRTLARLPVDADLERLPDEIGRLRAEQNVPLEAVLHTFRIDFRVLWESMLAHITSQSEGRSEAFLHEVIRVWEVIDSISVAVGLSYRQTEAAVARRHDEQRQLLLDALIHGLGSAASVARSLAAEFQLSEYGRFVIVCSEPEAGGSPGLTDPNRILRSVGFRSAWRVDAARQIGIVEIGRQPTAMVVEALRPVARARSGVSSPFDGLVQARDHVWLAEAALQALPVGSADVGALDDHLVQSIVVATPELSQYLARNVLAGLGGVREVERLRITETFRAYVHGNGSVTDTARTLCCHRNTVLNHLRRLEELTGRSLNSPAQLAELVLAMEAALLLDVAS